MKPTKTSKALIWFDIKAGKWYGDADVMRLMIKAGLKWKGVMSGSALVREVYKYAKANPRPNQRTQNPKTPGGAK